MNPYLRIGCFQKNKIKSKKAFAAVHDSGGLLI